MNLHRITNLLRLLFVILAASIGCLAGDAINSSPAVGGAFGLVFGLGAVLLDRLLQGISLRVFSSATIGLLVGLIAAQLLKASNILQYQSEYIAWTIGLLVYALFGYLGMMLAMRSNRDEFALIIPYVRFTRQSVQDAPLLVDTNIIIDGRLPALCTTGFVSGSVIVPAFIIDELQALADSGDSIKRLRGQRGLDALKEMQEQDVIEISIHQSDPDPSLPVDARLIQLAQILHARILSNDANLCKVAQLKGVSTLSLDALAHALRPEISIGDTLTLSLSKEGRDPHQAVGYMPDGTMIVVNNARERIGKDVSVQISSSLKTGAGRLYFAELV